jgi:septal ring factor EnvC (AmiA/AmiB activator)
MIMSAFRFKKISQFFIATAFVIGICWPKSMAQTNRQQLEQKRRKVEQEIAENKKILLSTQKEKRNTLHQLTTINKIIEQRTELIENIQVEIIATDGDIFSQSERLETLKFDYEREKIKLNKTIRKAYKTRKSGKELFFIFTSNNVKQALRRWKYLRKLSDYRRNLVSSIQIQAQQVSDALAELNHTRKQKVVLLSSKETEKKELETDKTTKQKLVVELSSKEKELREKIKENERQVSKLNREISRAIAKEIEAERRRQKREVAKSAPDRTGNKKAKYNSSSSENALTPESKALSVSFENNRGGLPWPVERGFISQGFGRHRHPEFQDIEEVNNGIDITTPKNTTVKAVFKGTVSAILSIPGQGEAILVNHGEYFTVYSRLSDVFVQRGQIISVGEKIGRVMTDDDDKNILQFQIWQGQEKQNPQNWLKSR